MVTLRVVAALWLATTALDLQAGGFARIETTAELVSGLTPATRT